MSVLMMLVVVATAAAQTKKISIQGFLKDADGKAVENGRYELVFKMYDVASGGTALWTETHPQAVVSGGVYSIQLGSITPIDNLPFDKPYHVGVTVQGSELSPRTELTYAPYAFAVNKAQEVVCSGAVGDIKHSILNPTQFAQVNGACWVPMDGRALTATDKLRQLTGRTTLPNGGGSFIRSQEFANSPNYDEERDINTPIATFQLEGFQVHSHPYSNSVTVFGTTDFSGAHSHRFSQRKYTGNGNGDYALTPEDFSEKHDNQSPGNHQHSVTASGSFSGNTTNVGGNETRPDNLNFWVYIRIN